MPGVPLCFSATRAGSACSLTAALQKRLVACPCRQPTLADSTAGWQGTPRRLSGARRALQQRSRSHDGCAEARQHPVTTEENLPRGTPPFSHSCRPAVGERAAHKLPASVFPLQPSLCPRVTSCSLPCSCFSHLLPWRAPSRSASRCCICGAVDRRVQRGGGQLTRGSAASFCRSQRCTAHRMTRPFQRHHRLPRLAIDLPGPTCAQVKVTDEEVVKARDFALAEIIKLSDSYRDMKINTVISAETARSVCSLPLHRPTHQRAAIRAPLTLHGNVGRHSRMAPTTS